MYVVIERCCSSGPGSTSGVCYYVLGPPVTGLPVGLSAGSMCICCACVSAAYSAGSLGTLMMSP